VVESEEVHGPDALGGSGPTAPGHGWLRAPDVIAAQAWLVAEVRRELERAGRDLRFPVRVVVPSGGLRRHLATQLAACGAGVGVTLQTLDALAREILLRAGQSPPDSTLFPLQVRREAQREPALAPMTTLEAGDGALLGLVDDMLDAGFEPLHGEVLAEHLDAQEVGPEAAARAAAAVRVTARASCASESGAFGHRSQLWIRAREVLERDAAALPARAIYLHGFADATGVQTDLLETLLRRGTATLVFIDPPHPSGRDGERPGPAFGAAFRARLEAAAPRIPFPAPPAQSSPRPRVPVLVAPDRISEVRAVAERIRAQLDRGLPPETIGIVARDLGPYRLALRTHLARLAIPYSGAGSAGSTTPVRRRLDALLTLLSAEGTPAAETWLAGLERRALGRAGAEGGAVSQAGLRHAFHALGLARVEGVARLAREGAIPGRRQRVAAASLRAAGRAAARWLEAAAERPGLAPLSEHVRWLERAVGVLGWRAQSLGHGELVAALASLHAPERFPLDADEFVKLVGRALEGAGHDPIGGAGGGVALLSVMEARARSFAALYVLGMNRGVFPRRIEEDALLPDALRLRMREVLPELPVKREGFDEERVLLAQLLGASPQVTLGFAAADEEGRELPRSPLLDALERAGALAAPEPVASWLVARSGSARPASPAERSLVEGLGGDRARFARALERALAPTYAQLGPAHAVFAAESDAATWAGSRLAVLVELDAPTLRPRTLGPYLGCVGAAVPGDRRREPPFVTTLEALARCPWQAFLRKLLRLEPPPDAVAALPAASDARLLGNVVHAALERIFGDTEHRAGTLEALSARPGREVAWPDERRLAALTERAAEAKLREEAIPLAGYARVLAARAAPYLEVARALESDGGSVQVLGAEVQGEAEVFDAAGERRRVRFKADRVDRSGEHLRLTDYKTGAAKIKPVREPKRAEAHRASIASGESLQAALYARATGGEGRFVHLAPELDARGRVLAVQDDAETGEALDAAAATLFEALDLGAFPPRLRAFSKDEEPGACRFCEVKEACMRGDSGARRRMSRFVEAEELARSPLEQAAGRVLALGEVRP
jgi:RecB family exonuclease